MYLTKTLRRHFSFHSDTIFNLASGSERAGICVIRISGPKAILALNYFLNPNASEPFQDQSDFLKKEKLLPGKLSLRKIYSYGGPQKKDTKPKNSEGNLGSYSRELLDKAFVVYFQGPKSFTGEDTVELHCHGSRAIQRKVLKTLGSLENFRLSEPGEFTKRAFFNGKFDLLEVEAFGKLMLAETEEQHTLAMRKMDKNASETALKWRAKLIESLASVEAYIDFEEDEGDVRSDLFDSVVGKVTELLGHMRESLEKADKGLATQEGFKWALIGPPNSGKSTLLNRMSRRKVAIVSDEPGTTRDILSANMNLRGYFVTVFDMAGIRESPESSVEKIGIGLAWETLELCHAGILVLNAEDFEKVQGPKQKASFKCMVPEKYEFFDKLAKREDFKLVCVFNKIDTLQETPKNQTFLVQIGDKILNAIGISAEKGTGISEMEEMLSKEVSGYFSSEKSGLESSFIVTNERQKQELKNCVFQLEMFCFKENESSEMRAEHLKEAVSAIGRLTGKVDIEEVLDKLFLDFCIGK